MRSRSFLAGLLAVLLPAAAVAGVLALTGGGDARPAPVNTVQGAAPTLAPAAPPGGGRSQPLSPTPALPSPAHDYAMPTAAGNAAVDQLVRDLRRALRGRRLRTAAAVRAALDLGLSTLASHGFRAVYGAPVKRAIGRALDGDLQRAGIDPRDVVSG